jgi:hypothetical protein
MKETKSNTSKTCHMYNKTLMRRGLPIKKVGASVKELNIPSKKSTGSLKTCCGSLPSMKSVDF